MVTKKTTKKATKKTTKKAATAETTEDAPLEERDYYGPTLRPLATGTIVFLPGSNTPLRLETDAQVSGDGLEKDRKWVGMLARDANNWELNIGSIEGTWSPVTCTRQDEPVMEE